MSFGSKYSNLPFENLAIKNMMKSQFSKTTLHQDVSIEKLKLEPKYQISLVMPIEQVFKPIVPEVH